MNTYEIITRNTETGRHQSFEIEATDTDRMNEAANRDSVRKAATSILRDWLKPDSWSTGTLRASAMDLVTAWRYGRADMRDLSIEQRIKLACIASGTEPRPEL